MASSINLTALQEELSALSSALEESNNSMNNLWKIIGTALVFWMHAGFSMLEAGSIREKNVQNILFKNMLNVVFTTIFWWFFGYALAFGESAGGFIGGSSSHGYAGVGISDGNEWIWWCFQWAFAATAVTIISGGMAERADSVGYLITIIWFQLIIYPVICHWVWGEGGWLLVGADDPERPWLHFYDYAGSSVVHMVGGFAAIVGCIFLGGREGGPRKAASIPNVALGTFILWMGWYGFNGASGDIVGGGGLDRDSAVDGTGRVIINTTISASVCGIFTLIYYFITTGLLQVPELCNGILAGLVAITAPCAYVTDYGAFAIGFVAVFFYVGGKMILSKFDIDDAIGAFPVHGCGGAWGILATGFFHVEYGWFYNRSTFMAWQCYGVLAVAAWTVATTAIIMLVLKTLGILRVDLESETKGLDRKYHRAPSIMPAMEVKRNR